MKLQHDYINCWKINNWINKMGLFENFNGLLRFRYRLYYAIVRSFLSGGSFIYSINEKIRFVCHRKDFFSRIIFISEGHEKLEMDWCHRWVAACGQRALIIDCGANIGFFSASLAQMDSSSRLLAIEGNKSTYAILKENIAKLNLANISAVNAILAEDTNKSYYIPDVPGREPWQQAKSSPELSMNTLTLDGLLQDYEETPDLVKVDCEGFEVKILKGASGLLGLGTTAFMVECNDAALTGAGTSRVELFDLFRNKQYKMFHLSSFDRKLPPGAEIVNDFPSREFNFAAIPDSPIFINRWKAILKDLQREGF